jgi:hypothetical protein
MHIKRIKQMLLYPHYSTAISENCIQRLKRKFVSEFFVCGPWKTGCPLEKILALSTVLNLYYKNQPVNAA